MAASRQGLRERKPKTPDPPPITNADRCRMYKDKIRKDPVAFEEWKEKKRRYNQVYKERLKTQTPEDDALRREKNRIRQQQRRARIKMEQMQERRGGGASSTKSNLPQKEPVTRQQFQKVVEKREKARLRQQKRRANMHPQKKRRENEKRMAYYYRQKSSATNLSVTDTPKKQKPRFSSVLKGMYNSLKSVRSRLGLLKLELIKKIKDRDTSRHETFIKRYNKHVPHFSNVIERFFEQNSIDFPGQKGSSKPKKVLTRTLADLHLEFRRKNPDCKISLTTFKRRRPEKILLSSSRKFLQCLCEQCVNPLLKIKVLNPFLDKKTDHCLLSEKINNVEELVQKTLCADVKRDCIERECDSCGIDSLVSAIIEKVGSLNLERVREWKQWEKTERAGKELVRKESTVHDIIKNLKKSLPSLAKHVKVAKWQREQYQFICQNVPPGHCVLTIDYAENYLCKYQDEVQSAHWSYRQVSVHPCVLHYRCTQPQCFHISKEYIVFLSSDLKHDACFTKFVLDKCIQHIKSKDLCAMHIFSDGCAAQYKSAHTFMDLTELQRDYPEIKLSRHYFGSHHGKSLCDSCGGTVKNAATRAVLSGSIVIQSAEQLFEFCADKLSVTETEGCNHTLRSFQLVQPEQLKRSPSVFKSVKGTRGFHFVKPDTSIAALKSKSLSCFCPTCLVGENNVCPNLQFTLDWEKFRIKEVTAKSVPGRVRKRKTSHCKNTSTEPSLHDAICLSPSEEIVTTPLSREEFFSNLQSKLCSFTSYKDLHTFAKKVSSDLTQFALPSLKSWSVHQVGIVDSVALKLRPPKLIHLFLVVTVADGNCMPRALSLLWFGDQNHHIEVRCRIGLELIINSFDYLCLDPQTINFLCEHSDHYCSNIEKTFQLEVMDILKNSTYMGMWQMMAAANVFQTQILSIYPSLGPSIYRSFCNRILKPRAVRKDNRGEILALFWSATQLPNIDEDESCSYWVANHIVPMLPLVPVNDWVYVDQ